MLTIQDLSFSYSPQEKILSGLSIHIERQTITAILGKNGCGKSTLLDTIIGFHNDYTGTVLIDGKSVKNMSAKELSKLISYIPQNPSVNMDFTVFEYILFGRFSRSKSSLAPSEKDYTSVQHCAKTCGITDILSKSINKISGGEKQLACIARAIAQESPFIIMDEPTAALDFGNQSKLFQLMQFLKKNGKTILFTTHNPNHALTLNCDVAIMKDKQICMFGKANKILNENILTDIYGNEIQYTTDKHFSFLLHE